ncbi:MAG: hypothetical protein LLF97_00535 [Planctomycetaceae bacterium]|nr:hypothetical protein [Planctomycetaceae bacterium]
MKRFWTILILSAFPVFALAQTRFDPSEAAYRPVVPSPSTVAAYSGWPGYPMGGGTAAGNALNGMASCISAAGDYNLATSAAAVNMTQAQRNDIQNRQAWTNTYFEMRATNRAARQAEQAPTPTMEQLARMARDGAPKPLAASQMDPINGRLTWPSILQQSQFDTQRTEVDQLFADRARFGGLNIADQQKVRQLLEEMFASLKSQVREVPPQLYVAGRTFLQSLSYAALKTELD